MSVKRINLHAIDMVFENNVVAVVRKTRAAVDVSNGALGGRNHGINWFAALVTLQAADVQTFVHLPAFGAHASKRPAGPGLAHSADEESLVPARFEDGLVGRWQTE